MLRGLNSVSSSSVQPPYVSFLFLNVCTVDKFYVRWLVVTELCYAIIPTLFSYFCHFAIHMYTKMLLLKLEWIDDQAFGAIFLNHPEV